MICQRKNETITWLLIAGMLHLMLISVPSGMVMANPSKIAGAMDLQSISMETPSCHTHTSSALDEAAAQIDCDKCTNNVCADDCSYCIQVNIGLNNYTLELPAKSDGLANSIFSLKPFDPGHTPQPYPPRQSHS